MLQISRNPDTTIEMTRPALRPRPVRRHMVTTIARARHQPTHARADLAARWLVGTLTLKPTWELAWNIFRVHAPQIRDALARLEANTIADPAIDHAWATATPAEKSVFVRAHLPEIWRLVDQATAA